MLAWGQTSRCEQGEPQQDQEASESSVAPEASSAGEEPAEGGQATTESASRANQPLTGNLLFTDGIYLRNVTVLYHQDGVVQFTCKGDDTLYSVKSKNVKSISLEVPEGYVLVKPMDLRKIKLITVITTEPVVRMLPFIYVGAGYAQYLMADINRWIDESNTVMRMYGVPTENRISSFAFLDGGAGLWFNEYIAAGVDCGYHAPNATGGTTGIGEQMLLSAVEGSGFLKVATNRQNKMFFTGTLSVGTLVLTDAYMDEYVFGRKYRWSLNGSTTCVKIGGGVEWRFGKHMGLGVDVGYRSAKITEVKADISNGRKNVRVTHADGSPLEIDYSGVYGKTGLRVYF
jgi:hypothetical protein